MKVTFAAVCMAALLAAQTAPTDADRTVRQLLSQASSHPGEQWTALLMRADSEAEKLATRRLTGCCGYRCIQIGEFTLTYRWNDIAHQEEYQHDLLKIVITARRGTVEGAAALALLLKDGCRSGVANSWTPYFKTVLDILDAPPWRNTDSPALIRMRAEAYETWWSLSKAPVNEPILVDDGLHPADFEDGAENARRAAIATYRRLLEKASSDAAAREHLRNLQAQRDTHQHTWYCSGD